MMITIFYVNLVIILSLTDEAFDCIDIGLVGTFELDSLAELELRTLI